MKRTVLVVAAVAVGVGIFWAMVSDLQREPVARDEAPAVIMRAPEGFSVENMGTSTFEAAAARLILAPGDRVGVEFSHNGDAVILLADRVEQKLTEMRAARTGTLVERTWFGEVASRLSWAVENGNLDVPGLPPPTGKNLYH